MTEVVSGAEAPTEPPRGQTLGFSTTLRASQFLGLSLKNGLLNIITLTLYRFWGKTEVRRRVWEGVRLNGDAFEYTGRGLELFIGFLMALVALGLPFLILVFAIQFAGPLIAFAVILPLYLFFFWLWGFGTFTAFRYMASRTSWRGVRFRLGGSATSYGFAYMGHLFLSGFTMGWWWPTAERKLAEGLWSELRLGDKRLRFRMMRAESEGVYGPYAIGWFGSILVYVGWGALLIGAAYLLGDGWAAPAAAPPPMPDAMEEALFSLLPALLLLIVGPFFLLVWAPYQAAMLRSVAAGVVIDGATFKLKAKALPLWWLTVSNLALVILTLGFLMPWAQARAARWLVERLESRGEADIEGALQTGRGPGSGEGLADAFGFSLI